MRLCFVTREYPSLGPCGGIGTYTQQLAQGLAARGHHVTVIARAANPTAAFLEGAVKIEPVATPERWRLPAFNRHGGMTLRTLPFIWAAAKRYAALNAEIPFDLVEVPEYQGWGLGVAWAARCPVVVRLHSHTKLVRRLNDSPLNLDTRLVSLLEAASLKRGAAILSNSQALAEELRKDHPRAPKRIDVLPLGIDTDTFSPQAKGLLRARLGLGEQTPLLLYVGRLERRKGVDILLEAFNTMLLKHPEAHLALVGFNTETASNQSSQLAALHSRANALGIRSLIHFLGPVAHGKLPGYYVDCDVFVAPSRYEPFGMIYLEAMAVGKAVIACDSGGVAEIITQGYDGLLVPPGDTAALTRELGELLSDEVMRKRLGAQARKSVLERFSLDTIAAQSEAYYSRLIARQKSKRPLELPRLEGAL